MSCQNMEVSYLDLPLAAIKVAGKMVITIRRGLLRHTMKYIPRYVMMICSAIANAWQIINFLNISNNSPRYGICKMMLAFKEHKATGVNLKQKINKGHL